MTQDQEGWEYQQMKGVWSLWQMLLKKIVVQHDKNFLELRVQKLRRKMYKNRPQLPVAGLLILREYARPHFADVVTKNFAIMDGKCYLMRPTVHTWVHQTSTYSQS